MKCRSGSQLVREHSSADLTGNKRSTCFHTTEEKLRERTETRSRGVNRKRQLTLETTGESDRTLYAVKVFQIVLHYS